MRIVVNDIAASCGGAMVILKQFYNYVRENDTENEWIFLLSDNYLEETDNIHIKLVPQVKKSGLHKLCFDFITGRKLIASLNPDVVLSLQNIITFGVKVPQYVYIHQSIPFQHIKNFSLFKSGERATAVCQHFIGKIIKLSAKKADGIIVQTEWMKREVLNSVKSNDKKSLAVLPDIPKFDISNFNLSNSSNFFYPTSNEIYKNVSILRDANKKLSSLTDIKYKILLTLPENTISDENIECFGRLSSQEMGDAYASSVLVFPSYIETVGLPLLEAMQFGSVILAADCNYSHEILKNYNNSYFFDFSNPDELAKLMLKCLNGELKRDINCSVSAPSKSNWYKVLDFIK